MNIILLSGGSGKRLWPLSNDVRSKQFIKLFKNNDVYESMVQRVYRQITTVDADAKITIATSKSQASAIKNQLGEKASICVEPCRRDTFPAIALAATYLHDEMGVAEDEAVVVCPVDPYVDNTYYEAVKSLQELAEQGGANLTLMGIEPTYPSEKYGYIIPESGENVSKVKEFKEKPDVETAKKYLTQSALWNAGIFAFKLGYLLDKAHSMIDFEDYRDLFNKYDTLTKISFDYSHNRYLHPFQLIPITFFCSGQYFPAGPAFSRNYFWLETYRISSQKSQKTRLHERNLSQYMLHD